MRNNNANHYVDVPSALVEKAERYNLVKGD